MAQWDLLITGAKVYDGEGTPGRVEDIAIVNGAVAARGANLPQSEASQCVEASGKWLIPGMLDIHTHLDLAVEVAPELDEVNEQIVQSIESQTVNLHYQTFVEALSDRAEVTRVPVTVSE